MEQSVDGVLGEYCCSHTETMSTSLLSILSKATKKGAQSPWRAGTHVHNLLWCYGTSKIRQYTLYTVRDGFKSLGRHRS